MKQYKAPLDRCMTTFTTTALSLRDAGFVPLFFVVLTQFVLLIEMQPKKQRVLLILLILSSSMAQMLDPSEIALAVGMAVGAVGVTGILSRSIFCYVKECCSPVWISFNRTSKRINFISYETVQLLSVVGFFCVKRNSTKTSYVRTKSEWFDN